MEALVTRAAHVFLLCALGASLGGCDYFKPAQPEAPSNVITFVPDYSDPDSTLATIAKSIADKGRTIGGVAYANAFADSVVRRDPLGYHQFFDPVDLAGWQSVTHLPAPDWGFDREQTFYRSFVQQRGDHFVLTWDRDPPNPDDIDFGAGAATIHRHYVIVSVASTGAQTGYLAIGYADLRMQRFSDGAWRIVLWNDRQDPNADPDDPEGQVTLGMKRLSTAS
jgi:hypothetical protein